MTTIRVTVGCKVSREQEARWKRTAVKEGRSLANFIRHAVETYIAAMEG